MPGTGADGCRETPKIHGARAERVAVREVAILGKLNRERHARRTAGRRRDVDAQVVLIPTRPVSEAQTADGLRQDHPVRAFGDDRLRADISDLGIVVRLDQNPVMFS